MSTSPGPRGTIGYNHVAWAHTEINKACGAEAAMFTRKITIPEILEALFDEKTLEIARKAKGIVDVSDAICGYALKLDGDPNIGIDYSVSSAPCLGISNHAMKIDSVKLMKLTPIFYELRDLMIKWDKVRWVLDWMNSNATPAQVRHYWPSVMVLCPEAPKLKNFINAPTRVTPLPEIGALLPLIRETANTVATMKLIPHDAKPREREGLWLTWGNTVVNQGEVKVHISGRTFFL